MERWCIFSLGKEVNMEVKVKLKAFAGDYSLTGVQNVFCTP